MYNCDLMIEYNTFLATITAMLYSNDQPSPVSQKSSKSLLLHPGAANI